MQRAVDRSDERRATDADDDGSQHAHNKTLSLAAVYIVKETSLFGIRRDTIASNMTGSDLGDTAKYTEACGTRIGKSAVRQEKKADAFEIQPNTLCSERWLISSLFFPVILC
jgi:hypothetical protein